MTSKIEYFIGGAGDKGDWISKIGGATNIMETVSINRAKTSVDIDCIYQGHEQEKEVLSAIKNNGNRASIKVLELLGIAGEDKLR